MAPIKIIAKASSVAALLSVGVPAVGESAPQILLHCNGGKQAMICEALAQALNAEWPDHSISISADPKAQADLTIRYVEKHRANDWLSGHLNWRDADGLSGDGPVIEYSVMDRALTDSDLTPYAVQLVRSTNLPL
ncbi:hypothetical protein DL239_13490 [Sedimentitalea sp. CY04]|uniref:Uncharacterized protein n=1 Tax=Parasedimentitalea denitrificans TaxID=2211118 RepID=A0ABX0W8K1_9RHOB|nr:hypothetical protein [Sedimentitalea sp. CY04]NIZ61989.1 hypothetical protein [Sedimentitalea sp. CY04]